MIDQKDKEILFELLQDCRKPVAKIAKAVKLPPQTTSYRIKKLEDQKIIKKYTANINYSKIGFSRHSLYLDLKGIDAKEIGSYLKQVTELNEVGCCYMLHDVSQWKVYISVWTKTIERYDEIQTKIIKKFKKHVVNYLSFQSVKSHTFFSRRLNGKKKAQVDIKGKVEHIKIKDLDWKIIHKLKSDSRKTSLQLSHELKTSINTISRRIKFLQDKDIIQRFYPIIDMNKVGYREYTFISRIDPSYNEKIEKFIEYVKSDPRFVIVIKAVGYVNLYYAFLAKDNEELKEIRGKIEKMIGKATLQEYKIEVDNMVS